MSNDVSTSATKTVMCRGERFRLFIDEETIQARIREIGQQINAEYAGKRPILIGVLNGAFMFLSDLMKVIDVECEVDFIKLSSYGAAKISSGRVYELKSIDANLEGRDVIVVEDIVDTGLSMDYMLERLYAYNPASIKTATLLHKYDATQIDVQLDYVGFRVENLFVLGYGLDYGQLGRNLPEIYILDEEQPLVNGA